ncbi:CPBP family intramembrane metalloprotease [Enterobacter sp. JMULE2]|uniref:CPBP family intramembrane glutamic endopeptidase n=1 Tax=Enterobacter sp. JMULE2 TaxID=2518340 RepID=UPI0015754B21|nr:CPBP family intramembrane glutamic endopeptidase [Enterobacter sp. JMULE2]NTZ40997.1 CPBP family intramembrane metalloprotease [Enterobacter sp. JMULE2]
MLMFKQRLTIILFTLMAYVLFKCLSNASVSIYFFLNIQDLITHITSQYFSYNSIFSYAIIFITMVIMGLMYNTGMNRMGLGEAGANGFRLALIVVLIQALSFLLPEQSFTTNYLNVSAIECIGKIVMALVMAPVAEEILFRGLIPEASHFIFGERYGLWVGVVFSAVLFAMSHTQYDLPTQGSFILLSLVLGYARIKSDGLLLPILLHSLAGAIAITGGYIQLTLN